MYDILQIIRPPPTTTIVVKKSIDVGIEVIDSDCRVKVGVTLVNFGEENSEMKMADNISQLIFETVKTRPVEDINSLDETRRGNRGYSSIGIQLSH